MSVSLNKDIDVKNAEKDEKLSKKDLDEIKKLIESQTMGIIRHFEEIKHKEKKKRKNLQKQLTLTLETNNSESDSPNEVSKRNLEIEEPVDQSMESIFPLKTPTLPTFLQLYRKTTPEVKSFIEDATEIRGKNYKIKHRIKVIKFFVMMSIVFFYMCVELGFGIFGNSLSLISDSFHMLSDCISYVIGVSSVILSIRKKSFRLSYGWARSQILGAMINSVFLLSVVYFIFVEAFKRFLEPEPITQPIFLLVVGGIGLIVDSVGLILFGLGGDAGKKTIHIEDHPECCFIVYHYKKALEEMGMAKTKEEIKIEEAIEKKRNRKKGLLNCMKGIFCGKLSQNVKAVVFHIAGDWLGSIGVITSTIIFLVVGYGEDDTTGVCNKNCWLMYLDPAISVFIGTILLFTTTPLFIQTMSMLLQSTPKEVNLKELKQALLEEFKDSVKNIHELHVWNLTEERFVASMHVHMKDPRKFNEVADRMKVFLHFRNIHNTTIQPEFDLPVIQSDNSSPNKPSLLSWNSGYSEYIIKEIMNQDKKIMKKRIGKEENEEITTIDAKEIKIEVDKKIAGKNEIVDIPEEVYNLELNEASTEHILIAQYDYVKQEQDELTFFKNDEITLIKKVEKGFWMGRLKNGKEGLFPINFVKEKPQEKKKEKEFPEAKKIQKKETSEEKDEKKNDENQKEEKKEIIQPKPKNDEEKPKNDEEIKNDQEIK